MYGRAAGCASLTDGQGVHGGVELGPFGSRAFRPIGRTDHLAHVTRLQRRRATERTFSVTRGHLACRQRASCVGIAGAEAGQSAHRHGDCGSAVGSASWARAARADGERGAFGSRHSGRGSGIVGDPGARSRCATGRSAARGSKIRSILGRAGRDDHDRLRTRASWISVTVASRF